MSANSGQFENGEKLFAAVSFAARAHEGQLRKDGKTPYISHPLRVSLVLTQLFKVTNPDILAAAVLHDTIEDTTTDYDELAEKFDMQIADWVSFLSQDKRLEKNEREERYRAQLTEAPIEVKLIKLADIYDNLNDSRSLDKKQMQQSLGKAKSYIETLREQAVPELLSPIALLDEVVAQVEKAMG